MRLTKAFGVLLGVWIAAGVAQAQDEGDGECVPPCRSGYTCEQGQCVPEPEPSSAPEAESDSECYPPCRSGYLCHQGQCVSACNPPCTKDEKCTSEGDCVPASPGPSAPPPESQPPSRGQDGWDAPGGGQQPPTQSQGGETGWRSGSEQPEGERDPGQGFRFALFAPIVAVAGQATISSDFDSGSFDLDPSFGFGVLFEGNFRYFGLGGGVRTVFWRPQGATERARGIDYFFSPRARIPFGIGEAYFTTPIGFSTDIFPGGDLEIGWNLAVLLGVQFFATDGLGLFFDLGGLFRGLADETAMLTTKQFMIQFGIAAL